MGQKEEILQRIRTAALSQFIENGIVASTMEGIARSAKTTKRTLYKYYPSKEEIFNEIISTLLDQFEQFSNFKYSKSLSFEKQIDKIIDKKLDLLTDENYIKTSKLLSIELIKSNPLDASFLKRFYESENKFINWIKKAQKDNKLTSDIPAELIANQFHSIIKGQVFYPVLFGLQKISKKDLKVCRQCSKEFLMRLKL